ncbi:MAG: protein translocase subunit SecF [Candidatus Saganbacteria bacterium]|nr:protein translocase subunit SecF [Candidatus Saganbacteria bacterium]
MKIIQRTRLWFFISFCLLSLAIGGMVWNSFARGSFINLGIDFTGGTLINLRFDQKVTTSQVRDVLAKFELQKSVIQMSGEKDVFIRTDPISTQKRVEFTGELEKEYGNVELLEVDMIGPVIGKELRVQAFWALLLASLGIIGYVSFRFEFKYAVAALIAVLHDAIITTGVVAFLWRDIELPFIAAILTIMGYSINDTIVIFDRIRENLKKYGKKRFVDVVNKSIAETLPRSINTVLTTTIVVLCLLFFGGKTLKDFSLVLLVGFSIGTYSSIFIASPLIALWEKRK